MAGRDPLGLHLPAVGRLFLRSTHTRVFDDFYTRLGKLRQERGSAKLNEVVMPFGHYLRLRIMERTARDLWQFRKVIRAIVDDGTLSDDQKRAKIKRAHKLMVGMAKTSIGEEEK